MVDPKLAHAFADGRDVAGVAGGQSPDSRGDDGSRPVISQALSQAEKVGVSWTGITGSFSAGDRLGK